MRLCLLGGRSVSRCLLMDICLSDTFLIMFLREIFLLPFHEHTGITVTAVTSIPVLNLNERYGLRMNIFILVIEPQIVQIPVLDHFHEQGCNVFSC